MKYFLIIFGLTIAIATNNKIIAQKQSITQLKAAIEASPNPFVYVKTVLKKKYQLDTIIIPNITYFSGIADSIAYHGKVKKVYGPYNADAINSSRKKNKNKTTEEKKLLIQVLGKLPNTFNRIGQVFIDTATFSYRIADSLADMIVNKVKTGQASFEDMAMTYSMGGEGLTKGDVGWIAKGALIPEIEAALTKRKKGDLFKIWTKTGVHIIQKTNDSKQDTGVTLLLRIYL